jgi:hypothetical protein
MGTVGDGLLGVETVHELEVSILRMELGGLN